MASESDFKSFAEYAEYIFDKGVKLKQWQSGDRPISGKLRNEQIINAARLEFAELEQNVKIYLKVVEQVPPEVRLMLEEEAGEKLFQATDIIFNTGTHASPHGDIQWFSKTADELKLAHAIKLTAAESAAVLDASSEAAMTAERKVASKLLDVIKVGGPLAAGVTAAEVVVMAKQWLDSLPDNTLKSDEFVALQKYVELNGPQHANTHQIESYLQQAEPVQ